MLKDIKIFSLALVILLLFFGLVFAKSTVKDTFPGQQREVEQASLKAILSDKGVAGSDICRAVHATITAEMGVRAVVKTAVELGHSVCPVVKCAIHAGGRVEEVIGGAMEAGATSDVVSRCAIDAGADAKKIEVSLLEAGLSLGYVETEGDPPLEPPVPPPIPPPGPPPISNSSF